VVDGLDVVSVGISDETNARAALGDLVRRPLRLDPVLRLQLLERPVEVVDADRDVRVGGAQLVGPPAEGWWIRSGVPSSRRIAAASRVFAAEYEEMPT
jgi:hypothetical protein